MLFIYSTFCIFSSISSNQITAVLSNAFRGVSTKHLNFAGNPLRQLNQYSFHDVTVTNTFTLSGLQFTTIPTRAFTSVYAYRMYLNSGVLTTIEKEAFTDYGGTFL